MPEIDDLTKPQAEEIIKQLGSQGTPPQRPHLVPYFSVGIDDELDTLEDEYLGPEGFIGAPPSPGIQSSRTYQFLVSASNGDGKTHFIYDLFERAYRHNYVASYVELDAQSQPLNDSFLIYKSIVDNIWVPTDGMPNPNKTGLDALLNKWVADQREFHRENGNSPEASILDQIDRMDFDIPRVDFRRGVRAYLRALARQERDRAEQIYGWLAGHTPSPEFEDQSFSDLDENSADKYIACVTRLVKSLGYQGMLLVFDEAEAAIVPSEDELQSGRGKKKALSALFNFLKYIRQPENIGIQNSLVLYCTTDQIEEIELHPALRTAFLEPKTEFSSTNPSGSFIDLEKTFTGPDGEERLNELGEHIADLYARAYGRQNIDKEVLYDSAHRVAEVVMESPDVSGRARRFVRSAVTSLHQTEESPINRSEAEEIVQNTSGAQYRDPDEGELGS